MLVDLLVQAQSYYQTLIMRIPIVPHKAMAEVSKIGNPKESLVVVNQDGRAKPLMD